MPEKILLLDWIEILQSCQLYNEEIDKNDIDKIDKLIDYLKELAL